MSSDDLSALNKLLDGGSDFSTVNPALLEAGENIAESLMDGGIAAWGVLLGRGVLYSGVNTRYDSPMEIIEKDIGKTVITTIAWNGDREGELQLIMPELGAKGVVAYMMALMMGGEANPETTALDEEGMDAYVEAMNNFLGSASQALRSSLGIDLDLKSTDTRIANFEESSPAVELGGEERIGHTAQIVIEGMVPINAYLLMPDSVTGFSAEIETKAETPAKKSDASTRAVGNNTDLGMTIKVPVRVILAEKKVRMEIIENFAPGSIIEFRKLSGELLDICAGEVKLGEGEVVITNEHFGIQVRKLVDIRASVKQGA